MLGGLIIGVLSVGYAWLCQSIHPSCPPWPIFAPALPKDWRCPRWANVWMLLLQVRSSNRVMQHANKAWGTAVFQCYWGGQSKRRFPACVQQSGSTNGRFPSAKATLLHFSQVVPGKNEWFFICMACRKYPHPWSKTEIGPQKHQEKGSATGGQRLRLLMSNGNFLYFLLMRSQFYDYFRPGGVTWGCDCQFKIDPLQ